MRHVETVLNDDPSTNDARTDPCYRGRITWTLRILAEYARALKSVRTSRVAESEVYKNGM